MWSDRNDWPSPDGWAAGRGGSLGRWKVVEVSGEGWRIPEGRWRGITGFTGKSGAGCWGNRSGNHHDNQRLKSVCWPLPYIERRLETRSVLERVTELSLKTEYNRKFFEASGGLLTLPVGNSDWKLSLTVLSVVWWLLQRNSNEFSA